LSPKPIQPYKSLLQSNHSFETFFFVSNSLKILSPPKLFVVPFVVVDWGGSVVVAVVAFIVVAAVVASG
jgi:hypothetical protein